VFGGIDRPEAARQESDGSASSGERARVGRAVDSPREAADHGHPGGSELARVLASHPEPIGVAPARSYDGHCIFVARQQLSTQEQENWRRGYLAQQRREARVLLGQEVNPMGGGELELPDHFRLPLSLGCLQESPDDGP
jgi:hypothetical protein